eukprot:scaffold255068_cov41-Tisochrysis_lutea.AAC.2
MGWRKLPIHSYRRKGRKEKTDCAVPTHSRHLAICWGEHEMSYWLSAGYLVSCLTVAFFLGTW